jgi:hypothetical protein
MSNVKEVIIKGKLPFNLGDDADVQRIVGQLHAPSLGLTMTWGGESMLPNLHPGGVTKLYDYSITGAEAVREGFLERIVRVFSTQGPVTVHKYRDLENETGWIELVGAGNEWKKHFKWAA